jgi:hypothetical protein
VHWNAGFTQIPSAKHNGAEYNLFTPHIAASGIWRARAMFHLMLESVITWDESIDGARTRREATVTLSPGFRTGWNNREAQTVIGLAFPVSFSSAPADLGLFGYFSYELPFSRP